MIDDTPTTDDIVQKTHEELLQRIEKTGVDMTAVAGKIQREYKTIGRIPPSEEAVFALLKKGLNDLSKTLRELNIH